MNEKMANRVVGFTWNTLHDVPLAQAIRQGQDDGFAAIEVGQWDAATPAFPFLSASQISLLHRCALTVTLHPSEGNVLASVSPLVRQGSVIHYQRHIDQAHAAGAQVLTTHAAFAAPFEHYYHGELCQAAIESFHWLADYAAKANIKLGVELQPLAYMRTDLTSRSLLWPSFPATLADAERLLQEISSPFFGLTVDTGHLILLARQLRISHRDMLRFLRTHAGRVVHAHVHTNNGVADEHRPLDDGAAEANAMIEVLERGGYRGLYVAENPYPQALQTLRYLNRAFATEALAMRKDLAA